MKAIILITFLTFAVSFNLLFNSLIKVVIYIQFRFLLLLIGGFALFFSLFKKATKKYLRKASNVQNFDFSSVQVLASARTPALRLDGLNTNNLLHVMAKMEISDLLNLADTNTETRFFVSEYVLKPKFQFHKKLITIDRMSSSSSTDAIFKIDSKRIVIRDFKTALRVLRVFGHLITKLEFIGFNFNEAETMEIYERINKHCAESLIDISIEPSTNAVNIEWSSTFENVRNVIIHRSSILKNWKIHQTFPKMRSLEVLMLREDYRRLPNVEALQVNFPHLKHLSLRVAMKNAEFPNIQEILASNQQLTSLSLKNFVSSDTMASISQTLPNLKALDVMSFPEDFLNSPHTVQFRSVRKLSLAVRRDEFPKTLPILFNGLETLHLKSHDMFEPFIKFIIDTKTLKHIEFEVLEPSYSQLTEIVSKLPKLEDINVPLEDQMTGDGISRLLAQDNKLKKITASLRATSDRSDLLKLVSANWELEEEQLNEHTNRQELTFRHSTKAPIY